MIMNSGSFESPKSYLFALYWKTAKSTLKVCNLGSNQPNLSSTYVLACDLNPTPLWSSFAYHEMIILPHSELLPTLSRGSYTTRHLKMCLFTPLHFCFYCLLRQVSFWKTKCGRLEKQLNQIFSFIWIVLVRLWGTNLVLWLYGFKWKFLIQLIKVFLQLYINTKEMKMWH